VPSPATTDGGFRLSAVSTGGGETGGRAGAGICGEAPLLAIPGCFRHLARFRVIETPCGLFLVRDRQAGCSVRLGLCRGCCGACLFPGFSISTGLFTGLCLTLGTFTGLCLALGTFTGLRLTAGLFTDLCLTLNTLLRLGLTLGLFSSGGLLPGTLAGLLFAADLFLRLLGGFQQTGLELHQPDVCLRMALFTGLFKPVACLGFILRHAQPLLVHVTQSELGFGVTLLGEPLLEVENTLPGRTGQTGGAGQDEQYYQ